MLHGIHSQIFRLRFILFLLFPVMEDVITSHYVINNGMSFVAVTLKKKKPGFDSELCFKIYTLSLLA
jgi:hypothetical protein